MFDEDGLTPKQRDAMLYGFCRECGSPRSTQWTEKVVASVPEKQIIERTAEIVCPNGHPQL